MNILYKDSYFEVFWVFDRKNWLFPAKIRTFYV